MIRRASRWSLPLLAAGFLLTCGRSTASAADAPSTPWNAFSEPDLAFLVDLARDAMSRASRDETPARLPRYIPWSLRDRRGRIVLTARFAGRTAATCTSPEALLVEAALDGGAQLGKAIHEREPRLRDQPDKLGIELEIIGPAESVPIGLDRDGRWTRELCNSFEPGVDGVGVALADREGRVTPGTILATNFTPDLALAAAERQIALTPDVKVKRAANIRYFRFRTVHAWQEKGGDRPVRLRRGMVPVNVADLSAERLDRALSDLAEYVRYRCNRDGSFAYCYQPATDRYDDRNNATAQMWMLATLLEYGHLRPDNASVTAAAPLLRATTANLRPLPDTTNAIYVSFTGHDDKLGTSAAYLLALLAFEDRAGLESAIRQLAAGLLSTQEDSGRIGVPDVRPGKAVEATEQADVSAALAILALTRFDRLYPDPRVRLALHRSLAYYGRTLLSSNDTTVVALHARALAESYRTSRDPRTSELVFRLVDRLIGSRVADEAGDRPELVGGIDLARGGRLGISTADAVAAIADGVELARLVGDTKRAGGYERALRPAVRFVLQLAFKPAECYYVRSPRDVAGGFRSAPWDHTIPIDNCARAMAGMVRARQVLYGNWQQSAPAAQTRPAAAEDAAPSGKR